MQQHMCPPVHHAPAYAFGFDEWLAAAGRSFGHHLRLDVDDRCCLPFGNGLQCTIELSRAKGMVLIYVPLRSLSHGCGERESLLLSALQLNMFGMETGGGFLGYDESAHCLLLTFSARLEQLDEAMFAEVLADLLQAAEPLHAKLMQPGGALMSMADRTTAISLAQAAR